MRLSYSFGKRNEHSPAKGHAEEGSLVRIEFILADNVAVSVGRVSHFTNHENTVCFIKYLLPRGEYRFCMQ